MQAQVQAAHLAGALKLSVASPRSPMAMLQHVRLTTDADRLWLESTDCEITVRSAIPAEVAEQGDALLHDALLRPVAAGEGIIVLRDDGRVSRGRSRYTIPALPNAADFPRPDPAEFKPVAMDPLALREALQSVVYCGDDESPRMDLRAVFVVAGAVWCTDGNQYAHAALEHDVGPSLAIPIAQVRRVVDALTEGVQVWVAGNLHGCGGAMRIKSEDLHVTVRLLALPAGTVRQQVAGQVQLCDKPVLLERAAAVAALRRFLPFTASTSSKAIPVVALESHRGEMVITDRTGDNRESLDDALREPPADFRIGCDPKRLMAALQTLRSDVVELHPGAPKHIVLLPEGGDLDASLHMLAPIKL